jgi:hypothetical protein
MSTQRIAIITDRGLPERSARISSKTWLTVKAKRGGTAFFQEGNTVLVGANPFDPSYILFVVDEELPDDSFIVSADVKQNIYPSTDYLEI